MSCEYLREFSKKFETALMVYSGAWGKLIHKKIRSRKSRDTVNKYFIKVPGRYPTLSFMSTAELWIQIHWIQIRIQHFKRVRIRILGFDDKKLKKYNRKFFKYLFLINYCNLLMSKLQKKPSALKREYPALKKWNLSTFSYVCRSFSPLGSGYGPWIRIQSTEHRNILIHIIHI